MLRAVLSGTLATANTQRVTAHGLGVTPDVVILDTLTTTANWLAWLTTNTVATGYNNVNVYCATNQIAGRFLAVAIAWQGRSY